jgi:hypothetical protein
MRGLLLNFCMFFFKQSIYFLFFALAIRQPAIVLFLFPTFGKGYAALISLC